MEKFTKKQVMKAIKSNDTYKEAAADLGIDRRQLYSLREKYNLL